MSSAPRCRYAVGHTGGHDDQVELLGNVMLSGDVDVESAVEDIVELLEIADS